MNFLFIFSVLPISPLEWNRLGVVVKAAECANRLAAHHKLVNKLVFSVLSLEKDDRGGVTQRLLQLRGSNPDVNASLLLQAALHFPADRSKFYAEGFGKLSREELVHMATSSVFSRVLEALFDGTPSAKVKVAVGERLSGSYVHLACDRSASHVVEKIWKAASLALKEQIAAELVMQRKTLQDARHGMILFNAFSLEEFAYNRDAWRARLAAADTKRRLLADFLE